MVVKNSINTTTIYDSACHKKKPSRGFLEKLYTKTTVNSNIKLNGKPLITYSITASLASKYIDATVVSTDSLKIADAAREYGAFVPFMRPAELASDRAKTIEVVLHAVKTLAVGWEKFDVLVLLQPTQPLRTVDDIDAAIELFYQKGKRSLASISLVEDHPLLIRKIDIDGRMQRLINESSTCRRQDMEHYYKINGCIYINSVNELSVDTSFNDNQVPFVMEQEHSVDIDEMKDIYMAEYYLNGRI